jgi:hypothetical protein
MVELPMAAWLEADTVRVEVPPALPSDVGLRVAVTPAGRPLTVKATVPENPSPVLTETEMLPLVPKGKMIEGEPEGPPSKKLGCGLVTAVVHPQLVGLTVLQAMG